MKIFQQFWGWYERHLLLNTIIASVLFILQLVHLYWMTTHVIMFKLTGVSYFDPNIFWSGVILVVDYLEIPAIILTSLVYLAEIKQGRLKHGLIYLFLINSQWLHIFWITDEYALEYLGYNALVSIPVLLAWIAIMIDYLELPVIIDTLNKIPKLLKQRIIN